MKTKTKTQDIYFAAAMLSLGARLEDTDKSDSRHMKFHLVLDNPTGYQFHSQNIPNGSSITSVIEPSDFEYFEKEWANSTMWVNATKYKDALQRLKSVIHSD